MNYDNKSFNKIRENIKKDNKEDAMIMLASLLSGKPKSLEILFDFLENMKEVTEGSIKNISIEKLTKDDVQIKIIFNNLSSFYDFKFMKYSDIADLPAFKDIICLLKLTNNKKNVNLLIDNLGEAIFYTYLDSYIQKKHGIDLPDDVFDKFKLMYEDYKDMEWFAKEGDKPVPKNVKEYPSIGIIGHPSTSYSQLISKFQKEWLYSVESGSGLENRSYTLPNFLIYLSQYVFINIVIRLISNYSNSHGGDSLDTDEVFYEDSDLRSVPPEEEEVTVPVIKKKVKAEEANIKLDLTDKKVVKKIAEVIISDFEKIRTVQGSYYIQFFNRIIVKVSDIFKKDKSEKLVKDVFGLKEDKAGSIIEEIKKYKKVNFTKAASEDNIDTSNPLVATLLNNKKISNILSFDYGKGIKELKDKRKDLKDLKDLYNRLPEDLKNKIDIKKVESSKLIDIVENASFGSIKDLFKDTIYDRFKEGSIEIEGKKIENIYEYLYSSGNNLDLRSYVLSVVFSNYTSLVREMYHNFLIFDIYNFALVYLNNYYSDVINDAVAQGSAIVKELERVFTSEYEGLPSKYKVSISKKDVLGGNERNVDYLIKYRWNRKVNIYLNFYTDSDYLNINFNVKKAKRLYKYLSKEDNKKEVLEELKSI